MNSTMWGKLIWKLVKIAMPFVEQWLTQSKNNTMRNLKK